MIGMNITKIDRYEAVLEHGVIKYYAIKGKTKYPMPEAFKDMYTDDYLAIEEVTYTRPELYDLTPNVATDPQHPDYMDACKTYIPRRTSNA